MSLEKLKESARKFEQKEDWRKAIEVYLKAVQQIESGKDSAADLSLYNRVGDLYLKIGDPQSAVRHYERAVDLYADQGFFNNAIALCGKILRTNPGRTSTYLRLAQLHARKNVPIEAKRHLLEYLERMNAQGQLDEAFAAVKSFADQFSGSQEIRVMLIELLRAASRTDEARERAEKLSAEIDTGGSAEAAKGGIAGKVAPEPPRATVEEPRTRGSDLIFLDTGIDFTPASATAAGRAGDADDAGGTSDTSSTDGAGDARDVSRLVPDGLLLSEPVVVDAEPAAVTLDDLLIEPPPEPTELTPVDSSELGLERSEFELTLDAGVAAEAVAGLEPTAIEEPAPPDVAPEVDLSPMLGESLVEPDVPASVPDADAIDLELVDVSGYGAGAAAEAVEDASADDLDALEQAVLDRPEDPAVHRTLAMALLRRGETDRARDEFEIAAAGYEAAEAWKEASDAVQHLIALEPDNIRHYQKLVEVAYRAGSRSGLIDAYLALAGVLVRTDQSEKALAVYQRVLDHDPGNARALEGLAALEPPPPSPPRPVPPTPVVRPAAPPSARTDPSPAPAPAPARLDPGTTPRTAEPDAAAPDDDFVDLGSLVIEESAPRDTRMRVEGHRPTDDEQRNFEEILAQFKRGIEESLDVEDYQAHYDLGVAFKEMGLLDEAIAEFQKALRGPDPAARLRTSEALGVAFYENGQHAIAETVLRRAIDDLAGGDQLKVGLLYWLGRALEEQGKVGQALPCYERAVAVDIRFMDASARLHRLAGARRE